LLWLRSWFQPAQAKPLLSARDVAELLQVEESTIPGLAAAHDVPPLFDPALGMVFSVWAVRRLLMEVLSAGVRFDRIALLWFLVGDPKKTCPEFEQQLENEIERIASLPEPARSIRRDNLLAQWRDAKICAGVEVPEGVERAFRKL
jgi:hypothetical protein